MGEHATTSSYLLTEDLGEKVTSFRHVGLKTPRPTDEFYDEVQQRLADAISKAIGEEHPVIRLKMRDIADDIIGEISRIYGDEMFVVSTCPEIAYPARGATIEVNRLVDNYGNTLGLGPRPGHESLERQFAKIVHKSIRSGARGIVVAEDGIFTGSTMTYVVNELIKAGATNPKVVAGFAFGNKPASSLNEMGVDVTVVQNFGPLLDWVPDHDFMPFIPGCGKPLGVELRGLFPFYDYQHATFCVPYVTPFGPVTKWASIPEESVNSFSVECINLTIQVFDELEKLNGRAITIGDIMHSRQRVSIPISIDVPGEKISHSFPSKESKVISFLAECL